MIHVSAASCSIEYFQNDGTADDDIPGERCNEYPFACILEIRVSHNHTQRVVSNRRSNKFGCAATTVAHFTVPNKNMKRLALLAHVQYTPNRINK